MQRPPSRNGASKPKRQAIVVPLFPNKTADKPRQAKPEKPKKSASKRKVVRQESKRLQIHQKNARSTVASLKPGLSFGRRVLLSSLVAIISLAALVIVAVLSPLLAVRDIEVVGANRVSAAAILRDLNSLKGKPLPQISSDELALKLSKYQLIDSVSAVALPPSRLRVVVVERSAIAIVKINSISYLYDAAGIQLGRAKESDKLPTIENAGNPASSAGFTQAISVLLSLPLVLLPKVASISAASKDNVVLVLRSYNQKILWGDSSEPALKAKVLSTLMNHYAKRYGRTFDVSSPSQPSVY